jgi:predicted TPR repeat methyltransferase
MRAEMDDPDARFETAKQHFLAGLAAFEAGRLDDAEASFAAAHALLPQRISTLTNLTATRLQRGRLAEALESADALLALEPRNPDGLFHRATALDRLGRPADALAAYDLALAVEPRLGQAWSQRGSLLRELGRADEAAASFERALAHGADAELNRYYLAAVRAGDRPATAPRPYVRSLFDAYAQQFDRHLQDTLQYRAPALMALQLRALGRGPWRSALDLGCGTGLLGPLVGPVAARLTGVDLSAAMLAQAERLGVYDELVLADIVEHLRTTSARHDLVLAADVFIYVGALEPVFDALDAVLERGGVFCFSVERAGADVADFELRPSLRYAHGEAYLRRLAAQHGHDVAALEEGPIRTDQHGRIDGLYVTLVRRA